NKFPSNITSEEIISRGGSLIYGSDQADAFGGQVVPAGDFNRDGREDLAVFAAGGDGRSNASTTPAGATGEIHIIYGKPSFPDTFDTQVLTTGAGSAADGLVI